MIDNYPPGPLSGPGGPFWEPSPDGDHCLNCGKELAEGEGIEVGWVTLPAEDDEGVVIVDLYECQQCAEADGLLADGKGAA